MTAKKNYQKRTARWKDMARQRVDVDDHGKEYTFLPLLQKLIGWFSVAVHHLLDNKVIQKVSEHDFPILRVTNLN